MSGLSTFSEILGYASIGCWLCAQFPQVLENIKSQSSEGLALPFLANWLAGDVSNLLGCILTNQLPFQTWLAIYFCFVDMTLLGQFFYYRSKAPPYTPTRIRATSTTGHRISSDRPGSHYRTLSTVAANVAASAALAAQHDGPESQRSRNRWRRSSVDHIGERSGSRDVRGSEDDVDDAAMAAMSDSFHSEGGRTNRRKLVSWNSERYGRSGSIGRSQVGPSHPSLQITASQQNVADIDRGRSMQREGEVEEAENLSRSRTVSTHRTSSRASRRGAGMVFLGVWALFGIGTLAGNRAGSNSVSNIGRVLSRQSMSIPTSDAAAATPTAFASPAIDMDFGDLVLNDSDIPSDGPSNQRVLGRIFAWSSTTLYMTSRLPQIWKNYARKSVEGLSVYLFIFAFLGNTTYVISILTSPGMRLPLPEKEAFVRESIPYILGSAGTLMSDITIVAQSFVYRPKQQSHHRRSSTRGRSVHEEEAGLLTADALAGQEENLDRTKSRTPSNA